LRKDKKTREVKNYVSYFNETTFGSRRSFWTPVKKVESKDERIYLHCKK
jgi:hypothetical protein